MPPLILVGPTASGKTGVAHEWARQHRVSILSADAMMVYRGMDIGTAKPSRAEQQTFNYQGIDLCDPDQSFSVHDYAISLKTSVPGMVVGGTGLYIRALLQGIDAATGRDSAWRTQAERMLEHEGFEALKRYCREQRPTIDDALPAGDRENPRRWIRAMERTSTSAVALPPRMDASSTVIVGLRRSREDLHRRIEQRVKAMFAAGLLDEVRALRARWPAWSDTAKKAIGYAEAVDVINGIMTVDEARERMVIRTRQYAKRQMTWFRHQLTVRWIDVEPGDDDVSTARRVDEILHG